MVEYFIAPILGGVIGYVTNDIAIRMLFKPLTKKYVFGIHVPFTPGLIPKEIGRIAQAIGDVVSENLLNRFVLEKQLLSDEMVLKVRNAAEAFIEKQKSNEETARAFLRKVVSEVELERISSSMNRYIAIQVNKKLSDPEIGERVAHLAMDYVERRLLADGPNILSSFAGGFLSSTASLFIGPLMEMLRKPTEDLLSDTINGMLRENGEAIVSEMIEGEVDAFLDKRVCDIMQGQDKRLKQAVDAIESIYRTLIKKKLPKILESVDISRIIRERIQEMDIEETEELILKIMKKELKAIVWLGALLGFLMGSINCIFF